VATGYLWEEDTEKSLHNDAQALRALDLLIDDLCLKQVAGCWSRWCGAYVARKINAYSRAGGTWRKIVASNPGYVSQDFHALTTCHPEHGKPCEKQGTKSLILSSLEESGR
jgi:hypothetical protein